VTLSLWRPVPACLHAIFTYRHTNIDFTDDAENCCPLALT
jgi:hypothetical protein